MTSPIKSSLTTPCTSSRAVSFVPLTPNAPNKHANLLSREEVQPPKTFVKPHQQPLNISTEETNRETVEEAKQTDTAMPVFSLHDLVGRTFLMDPDRNGNVHRAKIVEAIEGFDDNLEKNPTRIKFKCTINNEEFTDLIAYNEVADYISRDNSHVRKPKIPGFPTYCSY